MSSKIKRKGCDEQGRSWKDLKELKKKRKKEKSIKEVESKQIVADIPTNSDSVSGESISTVSIAIPGSILENAQSPELRTYLAGQLARAACIFKVDEVIVYDDDSSQNSSTSKLSKLETAEGVTTSRPCCIQLARILQYLECPQYLRKFFFPLHNDLKYSGLLNPLDSQHHLRQQSDFIFREGIITNKPFKDNKGSFVNVGLLNDIMVKTPLNPGIRVTVKLEPGQDLKSKKIRGQIVSPSAPRQETGIYWGYNVRIANSISQVFTQSPYDDGYDLTIGTSDRGTPLHKVESKSLEFQHILIVFGGVQGIETAIENDEKLNLDKPELLFDRYLNTVSGQGSRTIRTEEAILVTLGAIAEKLGPKIEAPVFTYIESIPQSEHTGVKQYAFSNKIKKRKISDTTLDKFD